MKAACQEFGTKCTRFASGLDFGTCCSEAEALLLVERAGPRGLGGDEGGGVPG